MRNEVSLYDKNRFDLLKHDKQTDFVTHSGRKCDVS